MRPISGLFEDTGQSALEQLRGIAEVKLTGIVLLADAPGFKLRVLSTDTGPADIFTSLSTYLPR